MKSIHKYLSTAAFLGMMLLTISCNDQLHEIAENLTATNATDYTKTEDMINPLLGAYGEFQNRGWEDYPLISVRGDDVNAGGLGDQQEFANSDRYNYANTDYWMFNSVWQNLYNDVLAANSAIEQIELYKEFAPNPALADQYMAEAKVLRAFLLLQLSRTWGRVYIPVTSDPTDLFEMKVSTKDEVMQFIADDMDAAAGQLPNLRPNQRDDIKGGVTRYTALAMKALANLELKNFQGVADATGAIIESGLFHLEDDYYNLFKIPGKLNDENLLELQYWDSGVAGGTSLSYLFAFFGPETWKPKVATAGGGWGFFEPSLKYVKFMLDRNEEKRLVTTVIFTPRGIAKIQEDPKYATLPSYVSVTTPSGDVFQDFAREMFLSGKHYLPSDQLTAGINDYGTNKNFICLRYAEILLMHAEARVQGASGSISADEAVNQVRDRADLGHLSGVTLDDVLDEKYAELATEWGVRYFDMLRYQRYDELSYDGRTFTADKTFLPYPQIQVDQLPGLTESN
ncbi:Starch-binding associating with outer membrane [Chryseolinea serpens]|uniref:Starch-binding associating with outer membrane n=1 Tax=Chryseolinea serpens TaxID=947013 RepID=A0A1M5VWC9_9BACT|nr:RagB/SusD family nutrient uptake outer membrane protein [Chryseolinea serpens]SHH79518.1 Starch-binding associating with outer membrane [Chryseolinea serpens]